MPHHPTRAPSRYATMNDRLAAEIERVRSDKSIRTLDEANVKQGVILPILNALGWNPFNTNEVRPEYPVQGGNVDYSLRIHGANKVFLEAKRPSEDLSKHQVQLLNYSFADGVPLAVLTTGLNWWFYLPLQVGSWEERRFGVVDLRNPDVSQTADLLIDFLSRENVRSGVAVAYAESLLDRLWQDKKIEEALPRAWTQLITDPHHQLLALLNQKVMELCGWGADQEQIKRFLATVSKPAYAPPNPTPHRLVPSKPKQHNQSVGSYKNKSLVGFTVLGSPYQSGDWIELLMTVSERIYQLHTDEFHRTLELKGRKNHYFCRNPRELPQDQKWWKPLSGSGYYVWSNVSSDQCVDISEMLLAKFGYGPEGLQIETA